MKKWLWVPILVILFFLYCCQRQEKVEHADAATESGGETIAAIALTIGNNLDSAVESLERGQVAEGVGLLLDSVLLVKPHDQWPEGFAENIASAKEHFTAGSYSDAVGDVTNALDLIKQTEDREISSEGGEIAPVAAVIKEKIAEAKEEFTQGNVDRGVIAILEALQLFAPRSE